MAFSDIGKSYKALGPAKFFGVMAAIIAWSMLGVWLQNEAGWPDDYGFHCSGRGCLIDDLWHSPALIQHGGGFPIALFCYFWAFLAVPIVIVAWLKLRKRARANDLSLPKSTQSDPE
jgi:hypothetical protein